MPSQIDGRRFHYRNAHTHDKLHVSIREPLGNRIAPTAGVCSSFPAFCRAPWSRRPVHHASGSATDRLAGGVPGQSSDHGRMSVIGNCEQTDGPPFTGLNGEFKILWKRTGAIRMNFGNSDGGPPIPSLILRESFQTCWPKRHGWQV